MGARTHGAARSSLARSKSVERVVADVSPAARRALRAPPEAFVEALDVVEQGLVVAPDAELEVPLRVALRPEPGAGPVGAAEVDLAPIDDDRLEVHARTLAQSEAALDEPRVTVERQTHSEVTGERSVKDKFDDLFK